MAILIVKQPIQKAEILRLARERFSSFVKAVVDTHQEIMAVGGELHADEEVLLTEHEGSVREHTWGINIYPERPKDRWIEFDSMINLKPMFNNRSRSVESLEIRKNIERIVQKLVQD